MIELLTQYALQVPNLARRGAVEAMAGESQLFEFLRFQDTGDAFAYEYNRDATLGGIGFRALNGDYDDSAKGAGIVNPVIERLAIMGGPVPIDRQMYANNDYKAGKVTKKAKAAGRAYVKYFFKGSTAAKTGDPRGFDGLYRRIVGSNLIYAGTNGGYLDLLQLDFLLGRIPGENSKKVLNMCEDMRTILGATIRAQGAATVSQAEWEGPNAPKTYNGARIAIIGEDEAENPIMGFDETRGSSNETGSIVAFRPGESEEEYVVGLARNGKEGLFEVEDQGVQGTTGNVLVEGRCGACVHHPQGAVRYGGILKGIE